MNAERLALQAHRHVLALVTIDAANRDDADAADAVSEYAYELPPDEARVALVAAAHLLTLTLRRSEGGVEAWIESCAETLLDHESDLPT